MVSERYLGMIGLAFKALNPFTRLWYNMGNPSLGYCGGCPTWTL
jgi:hypothetical protein